MCPSPEPQGAKAACCLLLALCGESEGFCKEGGNADCVAQDFPRSLGLSHDEESKVLCLPNELIWARQWKLVPQSLAHLGGFHKTSSM